MCVIRYKRLVSAVRQDQERGLHTPEIYIMVYKKAHAIVNCYIDSDTPHKTRVNIRREVVQQIRSDCTMGKITYGLFHRAAMEIFANLFSNWKKYCSFKRYGWLAL